LDAHAYLRTISMTDLSPSAKSSNVRWESGQVSRERREAIIRQRGCVIWFTGLSGAGKSTLAQALESKLVALGHVAYVLDGDNLRHGLCGDLGFTPADRHENVRRAGEVAALMADVGILTITAFISPYRVERERARTLLPKGRFVEVHVATSLAVCESRDPKGLYRKARAGQLRDFTGIDAPYEPPESPEVSIDTGTTDLEAALARLLTCLRQAGIIPGQGTV